MRITRALYEELIAHAREDAPNECCGVIYSREGHAVKVRRATNAAASPLRYDIDSREIFSIYDEADQTGVDLGAIYHSHTRSDPVPSQTDVNLAMEPSALYVIIGVKGEEPDVRAWNISEGRYTPGELAVE